LHVERADAVEAGTQRNLLDARQAVHRAIRAQLLREGTRAGRQQLRVCGLEAAEAVRSTRVSSDLLALAPGTALQLRDCETPSGQGRGR
jgi:hypothetical protein